MIEKEVLYSKSFITKKDKKKDKNSRKNRRLLYKILKQAHGGYLSEERLDIPVKEKTIKPIYYYIATSLILLMIAIGSYVSFIVPTGILDTEKVYTRYYSAYLIQNSYPKSENENIRLGILAYENKKYASSAELLERGLAQDPSQMYAEFFRGVSLMEIGQHKQSIESFRKIIQQENNPYLSATHWYMALTWIKLNNSKAAMEHLEWLQKNTSDYTKRADEILTRMNK